jgi:hypothetical protein
MNDCIADALLQLFRRFISAGEPELTVLALWVLHTHSFEGTSFYTPYLAITSPEKQSGKTRCLEVLKNVVRTPQMTASISPSALARSVSDLKPTLLLDELDALLRGDEQMREALRGILNSGFQADGAFTRMVGVGAAMKPEHFSTFCPKAMAGIGTLPDTIADRSIAIRLERSPRGRCEKFRPRGLGRKAKELQAELDEIRKRSGEWAKENLKRLADAEPECPQEFTDRQQDIGEPLLAIADLLGGVWPQKARLSLRAIFTSIAAEDTSPRTRLLSDIRDIFSAAGNPDQFSSGDLAEKLAEIETSPWGEWRNGKAMTARGLATQLKHFGLAPRNIRFDYGVKKGYPRDALVPLWERYVADKSDDCSGLKNAVSSSVHADCSGVADKRGDTRESL